MSCLAPKLAVANDFKLSPFPNLPVLKEIIAPTDVNGTANAWTFNFITANNAFYQPYSNLPITFASSNSNCSINMSGYGAIYNKTCVLQARILTADLPNCFSHSTTVDNTIYNGSIIASTGGNVVNGTYVPRSTHPIFATIKVPLTSTANSNPNSIDTRTDVSLLSESVAANNITLIVQTLSPAPVIVQSVAVAATGYTATITGGGFSNSSISGKTSQTWTVGIPIRDCAGLKTLSLSFAPKVCPGKAGNSLSCADGTSPVSIASSTINLFVGENCTISTNVAPYTINMFVQNAPNQSVLLTSAVTSLPASSSLTIGSYWDVHAISTNALNSGIYLNLKKLEIYDTLDSNPNGIYLAGSNITNMHTFKYTTNLDQPGWNYARIRALLGTEQDFRNGYKTILKIDSSKSYTLVGTYTTTAYRGGPVAGTARRDSEQSYTLTASATIDGRSLLAGLPTPADRTVVSSSSRMTSLYVFCMTIIGYIASIFTI